MIPKQKSLYGLDMYQQLISGNLLGNLWVLKRSMEELKHNKVIRVKEVTSLNDIYKIIEDEAPNLKLKFSSHINIGEYIKVLNEILFKIQDLKETDQIISLKQKLKSEKDNMNNENNLSDEEQNSIGELKIESEEARYWIDKLIGEVRKKINYYSFIFEGIEKLYSKEFFRRSTRYC